MNGNLVMAVGGARRHACMHGICMRNAEAPPPLPPPPADIGDIVQHPPRPRQPHTERSGSVSTPEFLNFGFDFDLLLHWRAA